MNAVDELPTARDVAWYEAGHVSGFAAGLAAAEAALRAEWAERRRIIERVAVGRVGKRPAAWRDDVHEVLT